MAAGLQSNTIYRHLRANGTTVFHDDFTIVVTITGSGSIAAWTFVAEFYDSDNTSVTAPTVAITDAANRQVTLTFSGMTLDAETYRWILFRTDTGVRTETAWGGIDVITIRRG